MTSMTHAPAPTRLRDLRAPALVAAIACGLALAAGAADAAKPKERYHVEITGAEVAPGVPADLATKASARLAKLLAGRKEFVATIDGAPPATDLPRHAAWMKKRRLRAFRVVIKLTDYEKSVAPKEAGRPSMVVKVKTGLSLLATGTDGALAITGDGGATIGVEVGAKVRPRDEELATADSLDAALAAAVDDAVRKLQAPPPAKPARR